MLIVFPLGLFITAVIFDIIYLINHLAFFPVVSYYNIAGVIIGRLLGAVFGFRDWLAIPADTRAKRIGLFHGLRMSGLPVTGEGSREMREDRKPRDPTIPGNAVPGLLLCY